MGMAVLQEREVPCREMGVAIQKWYGRGYKKRFFKECDSCKIPFFLENQGRGLNCDE